jgi:steroid delta-isomerase-like uncharacterized protein
MAVQMSGQAAKNAAIARDLYEAFNQRDVNIHLAHDNEDVEIISVTFGQTFKGHQGVAEFINGWMTAFPDGKVEITSVVADDRCAVVEFTARGTQSGPLKSPAGEIPPTNKKIDLKFCDVHTFRDGKLSQTRAYFDSATMLRQLGLIN